jgi:methionyl-tRNA synthetase
MKTLYLTTPIYYPNARPHVGSAYTTIVCDVLARYKRMCGYDVVYLTGTDEHGEKLERAAAEAGQTPSQFVAEKRKLFVQLWEKLGIPVSVYGSTATPGSAGTAEDARPTPDNKQDALRFIYTTHPDHTRSVRRMLLRAKENGHITKRKYEGRYCVSDERYISDGAEPANCDICGRPAELISEENYFFKLSEFRGKLLDLYTERPGFVQPDYRMNEVKSFVRGDLRDISISRKRIKWGIPFPLDATRDDPEQVVYVWYDALTSYMTGIGYAQGENGNEEFRKYWRNKPGESELVHMMGKDILRFHAVYWPAFIMAAYPDQPEMLPTTVFAHGWIYYEQDKMSKSKGNVVYPEPIVEALDSFGAPGNDALRYYLLREAPFGQDTSFSYEGLIQRYNSDLANGLGNLAKRTLTMLHQFCAGSVPSPPVEDRNRARLEADPLTDYVCREAFDHFEFASALSALWVYLAQADNLISKNKPWVLAKSNSPDDQETLRGTLYRATQALQTVCVLVYPVMPASAEWVWKQLGHSGSVQDEGIRNADGNLRVPMIEPGTKVGKPEPIFPRLDKAKTLAKLEELAETDRERGKPVVGTLRGGAPLQLPVQLELAESGGEPDKSKEAFISVQTEKKTDAALSSDIQSRAPNPQPPVPEPQPPSPQPPVPGPIPQPPSPQPPIPGPPPPAPEPPAPTMISIDDFAKVEMRVGEVKAAEHVPGASKLLKLMVDIGPEVRQVVAGLAEYYRPENLVGMKVVVVTNLQPRKLRGVESNGMIIAASEGEHGHPVLVTFKEDVANGARLK